MASAETKKKQACVIITIDGPAGAGKSTVAKELARKLGYTYLDTGAMYRALTLKALRQKVDLTDAQALVSLAKRTMIDIGADENKGLTVGLDGEDVTEAIRASEVTNNTFHIAGIAAVREVMVKRQREIAQETDVVIEGRDVGTVVFPGAIKKFYLDADPLERANRRIKELKEKGQEVDEDKIRDALIKRDQRDLTREVGPLKKAEDAILIDSTELRVDEVVAKILNLIKKQ